MGGPTELRDVREQRDDVVKTSRWRSVAVNVLVTMLTGAALLIGREAFFTWQRVNTLWVWAQQQEQARVAALQQTQQPTPKPTK